MVVMPPMEIEPTKTKDVADRLWASRKGLKLKQTRLCQIADITTQAWNGYEKGRSRIGLDPAIRVCQKTGLTLDWIFRGRLDTLPTALSEAIGKVGPRPAAAARRRRRA